MIPLDSVEHIQQRVFLSVSQVEMYRVDREFLDRFISPVRVLYGRP